MTTGSVVMPSAVTTGDVDGDGMADVVTANQSTPASISVLLNDINGDGLPDMAVLNSSGASVEIFLQQRRVLPMDPYSVSPSTLSIPLSATSGTPVQLVLTDQPPADGKLDIVVAGTKALAFLQNSSR